MTEILKFPSLNEKFRSRGRRQQRKHREPRKDTLIAAQLRPHNVLPSIIVRQAMTWG